MLYETAARASEILALNVEDLDLEQRRAAVRSKGGDTEFVLGWVPGIRPDYYRPPSAWRPGGRLELTGRCASLTGPGADLIHIDGQG
jgi:integrase